ncbi:resistance to inhibitors of cholinesterase-like domain-containing protein [Phthorimaea operculella]|nr:resistance to inhibitors of cholinesterase-like domain-containing protein [Phthorimaea operculella]
MKQNEEMDILIRVRSPLSGYFELEPKLEPLDAKPPPIPGMRPPLGGAGGTVPPPKSSMGFVMPIYTICIIVFFVYTLSKILFKRSGGTTYDNVIPDPHFRRRVFRDDSRSSPDKLGHKERDTRDIELEALRARLAETERAMQRIVGQLAARDAVQI